MTRLGTSLFRLFAAEAAALFGVALTILYLVQLLRVVEVGAVRDRGLGTLFWQTILGLPPLSIAFLYVCLAIGLARALRAMQASRELHIIHVSQRLPVLLGTILSYAAVGTLLVLLLAHVIAPWASRENNQIKAQAAADLVGRSLVPNRFAELGDGVTITVGGRGADGEITSFFADDRRDENTRRTYIADSALITADEFGYVLQLKDGTIHHNVTGHHGAATVMMAPAPRGTGIIAGGPMRAVFEVLGITDSIAPGLNAARKFSPSVIQGSLGRPANGAAT